MTIVDSLKAKGSTGGNNIAEAIKNLPEGGRNEFVVNYFYDETLGSYVLDKTYDEIVTAIKSGLKPVIIWNEYNSDFPDYSAQRRYEYYYSSLGLPSSEHEVNVISFINFAPSLAYISEELIAALDVSSMVISEDNALHYISALFDSVNLDD